MRLFLLVMAWGMALSQACEKPLITSHLRSVETVLSRSGQIDPTLLQSLNKSLAAALALYKSSCLDDFELSEHVNRTLLQVMQNHPHAFLLQYQQMTKFQKKVVEEQVPYFIATCAEMGKLYQTLVGTQRLPQELKTPFCLYFADQCTDSDPCNR